jgi:HEAT repeat protein
MKRAMCIGLIFVGVASLLPAQDAQKILDTFRRNFAIASLDVKIQILQDAAAGKTASSMGPLFQQAVDFVTDNASLIPTDARFNQLGAIGAEQIGVVGYAAGKDSVWKLFTVTKDSVTLTKAAVALGVVGVGDKDTVTNLNRYVDSQNAFFASGQTPDLAVFAACVKSLGQIGDPSSFPLLFSAMNLGYPEQVAGIARAALLSLKGDFSEMLTGVMRTRPLPEKKVALKMALDTDKLNDQQKADFCELALDIGLHSGVSESTNKVVLRDIRFQAAAALGARKWSHATGLLIEHLDQSIGEFDNGLIDRNHLLDAIGELGAMNTHEAAVRLTQFLVLINSYTEKGKAYDNQIVFAVLQNLGALGDKVAFDDLMYTQYLNYATAVKEAARAALNKVKW